MANIYQFSQGKADGSKKDVALLGGKGANLAEMCLAGLPIPPGLTIPTTECVAYMGMNQIEKNHLVNGNIPLVVKVIDEMADEFGYVPLVSIRSGARDSMPGMMDTILNVGLTVDNIDEYRGHLGDRCALDSFRRLIQMYANVVHGLPSEIFEARLTQVLSYKYGADKAPKIESKMSVKHLEVLVQGYLDEYETYIGAPFPNNLNDQLQSSIAAVFDSWNCPRAIKYREVNNIPDDWGTAVNVQAMVFGNFNDASCSGVLFSRNPSTGEMGLYGEWLPNAQGEDVVAGIRTPVKLKELQVWNAKVSDELEGYALGMEKHYGDMQDMEFTVQDGKLWMLQTRSGKRSAAAAFRIAHDMAKEKLITKKEAISRVSGKQYLILNKPQIDIAFKAPAHLTGIPAAGSIATGIAVFTSEEAVASKEPCILVAKETTPEDFGGMVASIGILTSTGGATSHAAVVARGMEKTCVVGCTELEFTTGGAFVKNGKPITNGTKLTMDGATGRVWVDMEVPVITQEIDKHVEELIKWASEGADKSVLLKVTPAISTTKCDETQWQKDFEVQLPESGKVYIDCTNLMIGKNTRYALAKLLTVAASRKGLQGIIGMTHEKPPESDVKFLSFLGLGSENATKEDTAALTSQLKALALKKWTKTLKSRWTVHLPPYSTPEHVQTLVDTGWSQVRVVRKLGELLEVDGLMDIDPALAMKLKADGVEIHKFIALLKDAGRKAETLPRAVTRERMIFDVLGKS